MRHPATGRLVPHRDPQAMRQFIPRHPPHDQALRLQMHITRLCLFHARKSRQHKIRHRHIRRHPVFRQRLRQPHPHPRVFCPAVIHKPPVPHRRLGHVLLRRRQIERPPDPVQHINDRPRAVPPADPQTAKPVDLGKRPRHEHVSARPRQTRPAVIPVHIFRIGPVQHQHRLIRQGIRQPRHLARADHRAGRIVRVRDEHQPRLVRHRRDQRIHIRRPFPLRHLHRGRPDRQRVDAVQQEPVFREQNLVPRSGIGLAQKGDDLVRTDPTDDLIRLDPVHLGNRLTQPRVIGVGIAVQVMDPPRINLFRPIRRAERVFIRRKFHGIGHTGQMCLATDIKGDVQNSGLRSNIGHDLPQVMLWLIPSRPFQGQKETHPPLRPKVFSENTGSEEFSMKILCVPDCASPSQGTRKLMNCQGSLSSRFSANRLIRWASGVQSV